MPYPPALASSDDDPEWFDFEGHSLQLTWIDDHPHWILDEICTAIGISNPRFWAQQLERDETLLHLIESDRGPYEELLLTEPGLYNLLRRSRTPAGRRLDRWVNHEVLPALRRGDLVPRTTHSIPQTYAEALQAAASEARGRELAERRVAELEPAAAQFHQWQSSPDTVYVVEWAKTIGLTQQQAYSALREEEVLFKQQYDGVAFNVPKRDYERYFVMVDEWLPGPKRWTKVPKITPEGQTDLKRLLTQRGWIAR